MNAQRVISLIEKEIDQLVRDMSQVTNEVSVNALKVAVSSREDRIEELKEKYSDSNNEEYYYKQYITHNGIDGHWNVIQVKGEAARYFVLNGNIDVPDPRPFISHGWIEQNPGELWFTDGEDFTDLLSWEKVDGVLIAF
ncbi:hypothetical protein QTG56_24635 (plasmid) [Rossellomorea sp. AcN35-11]|nr:hypothetical protein [Rossellomorea aquimaris]WJV31823.1 hypothetical protein QTG56_24635 [Rossellomorea sp. AcN35-11]